MISKTTRDRGSHLGCSVKKVFLEILQNSQENTCARVSFLIKLQAEHLSHRAPTLVDSEGMLAWNLIMIHHAHLFSRNSLKPLHWNLTPKTIQVNACSNNTWQYKNGRGRYSDIFIDNFDQVFAKKVTMLATTYRLSASNKSTLNVNKEWANPVQSQQHSISVTFCAYSIAFISSLSQVFFRIPTP